MAVNQIAVILVPPGLGLLKDMTGSFVPDFSALAFFVAVAFAAILRKPRTLHAA